MTEGTYRVRKVTEKKEIQHNHSLNFVEWGRRLSLKQYLQREVHLGSQTSCSNGNLRYYTLEEQDSQTGEWVVVSCLETLTRPSLYKIKGRPVQATVSHSIGAVFTPKEHRGKSHAKRLLNAVKAEFDDRNEWPQYKGLSEEALTHSFSALWSDIGLYYTQFGYSLTNSDELVIKVVPNTVHDLDGVHWITEDQIPELCKADEAQLIEKMDKDTEADGITRVAISPTEHVHELTHARAHYLAPLLKPEHLDQNGGRMSRFGASYNGVWMLWTHDFGSEHPKLNILRVHCDQTLTEPEFKAAFDKLLKAASAECAVWELDKIVVWRQDLPRLANGRPAELESLAKSLDAEAHVETRDDSSLPMWRPWQGVTKEPSGAGMDWVMDGKYAWF